MQPLSIDVTPSTSSALPAVDIKYDQVNYNEVSFNDFASVKRLGRGSYGTVVQGYYRGRPVAVKLVESDIDHHHVHNEAMILNSFKHENIIRLYATFYGQQSGLLLELMEGGSLHELLHQQKHIQYFSCHLIGWAQQVLAALSYLHSHGYVHRDLKPSNMLLTNDYITLKLCDFGTATELRTSMTNNRGSAAWMAPEVFRGKKYDQKCDIFSFGILLWEMTARRQPFDDNESNAYTILWQVSEGKRPPKLDCPDVVMDLMERCWHDKPYERPSVDEIAKEIDIICADIYPNRYMPLIDKTTGSQAFAHPPRNHDNFKMPPPYPVSPGSSNYHPTNRSPHPPPIPPPPRINGHARTSSHDFNLYGRQQYSSQTSSGYGTAVDYHPMISPQHAPLPPPNPPVMSSEIGWRRSSEPPLSDNDNGYNTNRPPKKKKEGLRHFIGNIAGTISKHL